MPLLQLGPSLGPPITPPLGTGPVTTGFPTLVSNLIKLAAIFGGILVLLNFLIAGYDFLTAGGDPKKIQNAWAKIWQSLVGLLIIIGAVAFISLIDRIFNIGILAPNITGPGKL